MKKKTKYADDGGEIQGELRRVADFLPSPAELMEAEEETTKVTLHLSKRSVEFFKREAGKRSGASYQRMIRRLLDAYVGNAS